jgi:membrane protease YdiL (CAAX protease family)
MSNGSELTISERLARQRVILAIALPLAAAVITGMAVTNFSDTSKLSSQGATAVLMSSIAVVSWLIGLRWYGTAGMGLHGGRPLYAGIGFAALGWIVFLALRIFFVEISPIGPGNTARTYIYLLLFEAFATQIWTYGLLFRAVAEWRGPITAAISSGIFFGLVATLLFQESYAGSRFSIIYFIMWGILYGIIRLRTGSLLGTVLIQSLLTFSAWVALPPYPEPRPSQLQSLYLLATAAYLIIIWRLWPKQEDDYRL